MTERQIRNVGDRSVLIECTDYLEAQRVASALTDEPTVPAEDVVPGAKSVLLTFRSPVADSGHLHAVQTLAASIKEHDEAATAEVVCVPVQYDGADIGAVADLTGLSPAEVVRRHADPTYTVAFLGFVPGFAYLHGLDPALAVPRRSDPRTHVPVGSVAIADHMTAIYPRESPGGWRLLATTDAPLFDPSRVPPALLTAGMRVRFVPT